MDSSRDNLLTRFATFWWALGSFLIFGVLLLLVWAFNHTKPQGLEDVAAAKRYKTKQTVIKAQEAALSKEAVEAAIPTVAAQLVASKPAAVEIPAQLVPNSPTAKKLAEGGSSVDLDAVNKAAVAAENDPVDPAVMEAGKAQYLLCGACHGQNGEGVPFAGPPLAGSEWVTGPMSNLLLIQMRGLTGKISVAGKEYDFPAGMAAMGAAMDDNQVASILTYIRNSFGNKASPVKPEWVASFRSEVGKPPLPTSELINPEAK